MSLQGREVSDELTLVLLVGTLCIGAGLWAWLAVRKRITKPTRVTAKAEKLRVWASKKKQRKSS